MDAFGELRAMRKKINNKGIAVIFLAISMIVLIAFVGLAVDIGYMYVAKGQLQNAVDAAALAGAARIKPSDSPVFRQYSARSYAQTFASNNTAAQSPVVVASDPGSNSFSPKTDSGGNDIQFGHWTPAGFDENGTPINAIKVRARRTVPGDTVSAADQGRVRIFFGKIFALLPGGGAGWPFMSASAEAIAALEPAPFLPIVVNEYWLAKTSEANKRPYVPPHTPQDDHVYPNSFVRKTIVTDRTTPSLAYGKIFAVLGSNADTAMPSCGGSGGSANVNGYVNIDFRNSKYAVASGTWYQLKTGNAAASDCSSGCIGTPPSGFNGPMTLTQGDVDSGKKGTSLQYVYGGYPDNYMPPTAIYERDIRAIDPSATYPCGTAAIYGSPTTSNCPFATVAYFSSSGNPPINNTTSPFNGKGFSDNFPAGKKVVAMVYDGTFRLLTGSGANGVTIVGYILLQIDGYSSNNAKNLDLTLTPNQLSPTQGNTCYAHAISDIVEPSAFAPIGGCDPVLVQLFNNLKLAGATPKLVK
jgi:Putative Flp pilus-assembly TadE/G-like